VPAGADPHTFEPSPSDVKKVAEADIAFANGLDLEPSAIRLIEANLKDGAPFALLAELALTESGGKFEGADPHLWMDPEMAGLYAAFIFAGLAGVDIDGAEEYGAGNSRFASGVDDARSYLEDKIAPLPAQDRKLVTTHDAFGRFADAFGLQIVAVVVGSPGQEPSPEDVADLTRAIEEQDVPAVFREPQLDSEGRILEQAAEDAGVHVCTLYSDSLDDRVTSYIEMMRFNADEIARCLGGDSGG
jgi:ABC-type Zn uptake system ZnuABC Zn-binding protein ZnuA